jgi:hypothetical protein
MRLICLFIAIQSCFAFAAETPVVKPDNSQIAFSLLLREIWRQEYQIMAENKGIKEHASPIAKKLAWQSLLLINKFKVPLEFDNQMNQSEAVGFDIDSREFKQLGKQSFDQLQRRYWSHHPIKPKKDILEQLIVKSPRLKADCDINLVLKKTALDQVKIRDCQGLKESLIVLYGGHKERFDHWLAANQKHSSSETILMLTIWNAIRNRNYSQSLDLLFPLSQKEERLKVLYESIQRLYSFMEKGRGSVAIKRL